MQQKDSTRPVVQPLSYGMIHFMVALCFLITPPGVLAGQETRQYTLTPTFWAAGIDIDATTIDGRSVSADTDFEFISNNLDFGAAAGFEYWFDGWGVMVSDIYIDLGLEADFRPRIGPTLSTDLDIRMNLFEAALLKSDILSDDDSGNEPPAEVYPRLSVEPMGGIRIGALKQELDLKLTASQLVSAGEPSRTIEGSDWWLELFVGGRLKYDVNQRWELHFRGDIGGMKAGGESVFSWSLSAGLEYRPWKVASFQAGYRIYDFNYENEKDDETFELDAMLHGPVFGVSFFF
jgi:hypothetical protein